jgi:hypothetical protein
MITEMTGEMDGPWGVPTRRERGSAVRLLKRRRMRRSVRKERSHLANRFEKPSSLKTRTSLAWLIFLKYQIIAYRAYSLCEGVVKRPA